MTASHHATVRLALALALASATASATACTVVQRQPDVTGTYRLERVGEAGCLLHVAEQPAVPQVQVRVALDCSRGAPSFNSGTVAAVVPLVDGVAVERIAEFGQPCELRFRFAGDSAVVAQTGSDGDCGFGYGVFANGTYRRTSRAVPTFVEGR